MQAFSAGGKLDDSWTSELTPFDTKKVHGDTDPWGPVRSSQDNTGTTATATTTTETDSDRGPDKKLEAKKTLTKTREESRDRGKAVMKRVRDARLAKEKLQRSRESLVRQLGLDPQAFFFEIFGACNISCNLQSD